LSYGETINSIGSSIVGIPGFFIKYKIKKIGVFNGRNDFISWSITKSAADTQDVYVMGNEKDDYYKYNDKIIKYEKRNEIIKIKSLDDYHLNILDSVYGPVINNVFNIFGFFFFLK
jgi:acyl-homoserine lactone acylase PvdQ